MEPERSGRIMGSSSCANPNGDGRAVPMKPFDIPKRLVVQAWRLVRANRGAPGVDEESLDLFERDFKRNLYRIWNRMSSGSYFPAPVKEVMIPKKSGGQRPLGIPTVSDRVAQTVVKLVLEPELEPHFHEDSYGTDREDQLIKQSRSLANVAGGTIGCLSLISGECSITSITRF